MSGADASGEVLLSKSELPRKIRSQQCDLLLRGQGYIYRQHGRKTHDVVAPEHALDFGQVGLVEVSAIAGRLQVYATDIDVQRVFLRSDDQVGAVGAQFAADLVANVGRDRDHRSRNADSEHDGYAGQEFAPLLPAGRTHRVGART